MRGVVAEGEETAPDGPACAPDDFDAKLGIAVERTVEFLAADIAAPYFGAVCAAIKPGIEPWKKEHDGEIRGQVNPHVEADEVARRERAYASIGGVVAIRTCLDDVWLAASSRSS